MVQKFKLILSHLIGLTITAVFTLPLFWVVIASLRQPGLPPPLRIEWWPAAPHWQNYTTLFTLLPMTRYISNSLFVVAIAVPLTLLTASLAGFGISQLPFVWQQRWINGSIALLIIPAASVWLFRFQLLRWLGLIDSLWALIVPAFGASNPLFVLLFYWTFRRIPPELFEVPQLDGATSWVIWWRIALPLARPTAVAVTILAFIMYWSDFVSPIIYISRPQSYTLPVGLQILNQLDSTNWPLLMAAAVVMIGPIILLFTYLQRYFLHNKNYEL